MPAVEMTASIAIIVILAMRMNEYPDDQGKLGISEVIVWIPFYSRSVYLWQKVRT